MILKAITALFTLIGVIVVAGGLGVGGYLVYQNIANPLPTPTPFTQVLPAQIEVTLPTTVPTATNKSKPPVKPNREIVTYFEICTGKTINVYYDELKPYFYNGKTFYVTTGDIDCFENHPDKIRAWATKMYPQYVNKGPQVVVVQPSPTIGPNKAEQYSSCNLQAGQRQTECYKSCNSSADKLGFDYYTSCTKSCNSSYNIDSNFCKQAYGN